jgi:Aldo/keto reductase family
MKFQSEWSTVGKHNVNMHVERSLSAMEKLFYLVNQHHSNHFAMVGEVAGPTRIEQWHSDGVPAFRQAPQGFIPMKVLAYDASGWTTEVAAQLTESFDESRPPLLRATLLHGADRSIIILAAHHSIADGLSLRLTPDTTRTLRDRARAEGTTVQSALSAALAAATALRKAGTYPLGERTVKRIGYGAMQLAGPGVFGPPKDRDSALAVLREAVAAGVNHIDTSDFYGPHITNQLIRDGAPPLSGRSGHRHQDRRAARRRRLLEPSLLDRRLDARGAR